MKITQHQFDAFRAEMRDLHGRRSKAALTRIGVEVERSNVERAKKLAETFILARRSAEVRAALALLGRSRVAECTEAEAARLYTYLDDLTDDEI